MPVPYDVEGALSLGMEGEFNTIPAQYDILVGTSPWLRYVEYFVDHVDQDSGGDQHFFDIVRTTPYQNDTIWSTTAWKTVKFFERMDSSLQTASLDRRADGVGQDHDAAGRHPGGAGGGQYGRILRRRTSHLCKDSRRRERHIYEGDGEGGA